LRSKRQTNPGTEVEYNTLQLSLLRLSSEVGHEDIAQFTGSFVQVVAHAVGAETLADDVEVDTKRNQ